jgi:hypothetical protein
MGMMSSDPHNPSMEVTMSSQPASPASTRRGTWRWSVALLATALMVVAGSGLVAFAQSGAGASRGPVFLPAETSVYLEGRMDMPDGQAEAMAEFLSAFPGFADTGSFEMIFEQVLDGLMSEATFGEFSYSEDLAPLMTGEVGVGILDLAGAAMMADEAPPILAGVAVTDPAAASAFVSGLAGTETGAELVEEPYGQTSILSDQENAIAVAGEWVLMAPTVDAVKSGIDVLSGEVPSLAEDAEFASAWARVPAGHIVAAYMDFATLGPLMEMATDAAAGQTGMTLDLAALAGQLPIDMVAYLTAEGDRMTLEAFITPAEQTPAVALGDSDLATVFPGDTQLFVETRELGTTLGTAITGLLATLDEESTAELAPFEDMLGTPLDGILDFVADASIGASLSSDGLWLGMAAEVTDEDVANERVERILSIIRLLGSGLAGEDAMAIEVEDATIAGTDVTVITLPVEEVTGGDLPIAIPDTVSVAVADGQLLIGLGEFVENALTMSEADSLAASPGYVDAVGEDTTNSGLIYANIGSFLSMVDPLLAMMAPEWEDIAPYATALDRFIAVGTADDDVISVRMSVIVAP